MKTDEQRPRFDPPKRALAIGIPISLAMWFGIYELVRAIVG